MSLRTIKLLEKSLLLSTLVLLMCMRPYASNKLAFWIKQCILLGHSSNHLGYHCYDPVIKKLYLSCHIFFYERLFPAQQKTTLTQTPPSYAPSSHPLLILPHGSSHTHSPLDNKFSTLTPYSQPPSTSVTPILAATYISPPFTLVSLPPDSNTHNLILFVSLPYQ
jgi:hypothetical protein